MDTGHLSLEVNLLDDRSVVLGFMSSVGYAVWFVGQSLIPFRLWKHDSLKLVQ